MNRLFTDSEIIQKLQKGGAERQEAWKHMYLHWYDYFRNKIQQQGGTSDEALQALASVCTGWEKRVCMDSFSLNKVNLKNYLGKSVYYAWLRMKKQNLHYEDLDENRLAKETADAAIIDEELQVLLSDVLQKSIGERCRKVLFWYAEGYSLKEIGIFLEITADSAKNLKSKCSKKLSEYFRKHPEKVQAIKRLLHG